MLCHTKTIVLFSIKQIIAIFVHENIVMSKEKYLITHYETLFCFSIIEYAV